MNVIEKILLENRAWAAEKTADDPGFFKRLAAIQNPEFLWIGCSDSRVPANEITGTQPGEIFVHRNVANLVVLDDLNLLTVLEYAVKYLKVKHIIVCGHYGCGGVIAAASHDDFGIINHWLTHIKKVETQNILELEEIKDPQKRLKKLVEFNVIEQVKNLAKTDVIKESWTQNQGPMLHGWVYGLNDGLINPIFKLDCDFGA